MGVMRREREHVAKSTLNILPRTGHVKDMDMGIVVNYCTELHKANDPPPIPVVDEMS